MSPPEVDANAEIDDAADKAQKRLDEAAKKAEAEIKKTCDLLLSDIRAQGKRIKNTNPIIDPEDKGTLAYRVNKLEKTFSSIDERFDAMSQRMAVRESAITPESIQSTVQIVTSTRRDTDRIDTKLSKSIGEIFAKFEKVNDRIDALQLKSQEYYSVINPNRIQSTLEVVTHTEKELVALRDRFEEFQKDRIRRLEETNRQIGVVRDLVTTTETRLMEKVDRNQIRSQQYVIGVVVGLIMTVLTSIVLTYLHV